MDFLLWTLKNPIDSYSFQVNDSLPNVLSNSSFSPNLETKILIHGYGDTGDTDWIIRVKNKYLKKGKYRDWIEDYIGQIIYTNAVINVIYSSY